MFEKEKEILVNAGKTLLEKKLTVGTLGNISLRVEKDKCLITPTNMNYWRINRSHIVLIDLDGNVLEGEYKPSTEKLLHCEIYKARKDVNAIIHYHPLFSSVLSVTGDSLPMLMEDSAMILGREIKVTRHALAGSMELAKEAVKALGDNFAVILANHGTVCVGKDLDMAFTGCEVLEKTATIYIITRLLGKGF